MASKRFYPEKLIKPCPPSNPDCHCTEIHTPEGTYTLLHELYQENTQPQFNSGTHVTFFCPTSTSSTTPKQQQQQQQHQQQNAQFLSIPCNYSSTTTSSISDDGGDFLSSVEEELDDKSSSSNNSTQNIPLDSVELFPASRSPKPTIVEISTEPTTTNTSALSSFWYSSRSHHHHHKKPKHSLSKFKSSFIEYMTPHEQLQKMLGERTLESSNIFYNVGLNMIWQDEQEEPPEPLTKITFGKAYPTCHDVNVITSSVEHIDVIIGFSSGDLIWYDFVCNRFTRLNKNGIMNGSSVTMVKWIPGSEDLFMASFDDGTILILDKDRDDQAFVLPEPQTWAEEQFQITKPNKHNKHNPVAHWRVSQKGITAFAFSPNNQYIATVGKDGLMRTIDYTNERLCDIFVGYFGRLLCVAWSPDGKYILTGGQDDLVTIWSFKENKIIARCQGHRSWVTGVAFDPLHCDDKDYRFASVGEDCKILLWDFSVNALHKPKQKRASITTLYGDFDNQQIPIRDSSFNKPLQAPSPLKKFRKRSSIFGNNESTLLLQSAEATQHVKLPTIHPALNVVYKDDSVITTDRRGRVRAWRRPTINCC
ncbi:hypothetical protein [Parasitella parasitica]|uniref:Uncharacterized protein n=1 Tax=Parasitella parasitica TaxID=35722 RepID=A0A0B7MXJ8_9FUNG|nr:hypothetical protein [Parasitella parasitica]